MLVEVGSGPTHPESQPSIAALPHTPPASNPVLNPNPTPAPAPQPPPDNEQLMLEDDQEFNPNEEYVEYPNGPPDDLKLEIKAETDVDSTVADIDAVTA